jgi:hypothetical protein
MTDLPNWESTLPEAALNETSALSTAESRIRPFPQTVWTLVASPTDSRVSDLLYSDWLQTRPALSPLLRPVPYCHQWDTPIPWTIWTLQHLCDASANDPSLSLTA